jgi:hypothetical protein
MGGGCMTEGGEYVFRSLGIECDRCMHSPGSGGGRGRVPAASQCSANGAVGSAAGRWLVAAWWAAGSCTPMKDGGANAATGLLLLPQE